MSESTDLLAYLGDLRHRTREDRRGHAFPLLLFGALILAAPLLYVPPTDPDFSVDGWDPRVDGSNLLVRIFRTTAGTDPAYPTLVAWYWLAVLVGGFGATVWWYRRRAARVGIETDTRAVLITAAAAFVGCFIGTFAFSRYALSLYGAWQVNLSLMFGSLALTGLVLWWNRNPGGVFLASVSGAVAFSSIAVYTNRGFSALLVIACGLLVLAWLERSTQLGVIGVLFTLVAIPSTAWISNPTVTLDPGYLFSQLGWEAGWGQTQVSAAQHLILPAAVLLIGGAVATRRPHR